MDDELWTYSIHNRDGDILGTVPGVTEFPFHRVANDVSTGSADIVIEPGTKWGPLLTRTHGTILVKSSGTRIHGAGYIENVDNWDPAARKLSLTLVDVRDQLASRLMYPVEETTYRAGTVTVAGKNYSGAVRGILIPSATGRGPGWDLPLVLPPDGTGTIERVYLYWDMVTPDKALQELSDLDDGPDLDLEPRFREDGGLEWVVRLGGPRLSGPDVEVNLAAPENAAMEWSWQLNGQDQRTGSVAVGNGTEVDMLVGFGNNLPGPDIIVRDLVESYKEITDPGQIIGHAYSDLWANRYPTEQWTLTLDAEHRIGETDKLIDRVRIGSRISLGTTGDPVIPDGWHDLYCIGYETTTGTDIKLDLQPIRELA